jgi:hypothetical protein
VNDDVRITAIPGLVSLHTIEFRGPDTWIETLLSPDQARLLGLALISASNKAEEMS